MLWKKIAMFALTTGLATQALKVWLGRAQAKNNQRNKKDHAHAVQRWEDEGGTPITPSSSADATTPVAKSRARKTAAPRTKGATNGAAGASH